MKEYFINLLNAKYLNPDAFWLLIVPLAIGAVLLVRKSHLWVSILIRIFLMSLIVLSLSNPVRQDTTTYKVVSVIVDVSASIKKQGLESFSKLLHSFLSNDPDMEFVVFPFAKDTSTQSFTLNSDSSVSNITNLLLNYTKNLNIGDTNIESALRDVASQTNSSSILLLSDGFETVGDARSASKMLNLSTISVYPLVPDDSDFKNSSISISSLYAPTTVNSGETAQVRVGISNSHNDKEKPQTGILEIWQENQKIFSEHVNVESGKEKLFTTVASTKKGGLQRIKAMLYLGNNKTTLASEQHTWLSVKEKDKILFISGTQDDRRIIGKLLSLTGHVVEDIVADGSTQIPTEFKGYASVVMNNTAKKQLPSNFLDALNTFVKNGGGLLLIGGDRSFGLGGYIDTPLEQMSPVKFVPPQTEQKRLNSGVILVIDKSRSMTQEGRINDAKNAALTAIEGLKPDDYVGVIGFDASPFVIIRFSKVNEVKPVAESRLRNLTAAGGTNLLPALSNARASFRNTQVSRKHIIVLSDGQFPLTQNEYTQEIEALRAEGITVSGVALGGDADVGFMQMLAKYGKGTFYHTVDSKQLPQIFLKDIKISTGEKTLKEDEEFPLGIGQSGLRSTTVEPYAPLKGFVETEHKDNARLEIFTRKDGKTYPILSSWDYLKGTVVAFTSDANGRWSLAWVERQYVPRYFKFWNDILDSVKNKSSEESSSIEFDLRYNVQGKTISFDLSLFDKKLIDRIPPPVIAKVVGPDGNVKNVSFAQTVKGRFVAEIPDGRPGDYNLSVSYGDILLPPMAITLGGDVFGEKVGRGINIQTLSDIATLSNGLVNPAKEQILSTPLITKKNELLFMPLAIIAFFLLILEALIREGTIKMLISRLFIPKTPQLKSKKPQGAYIGTKRVIPH